MQALELRLRGNRMMAEIEALQKKYGLVLKAVIVPRDNGQFAEAKIIAESSDLQVGDKLTVDPMPFMP